ncbi:SAM-dependent methyltransferase [Sporosarcina ureilytica]|uniref:SAM-dependent methyltransferase n=1 Tax=Sporosarcina ureilytica TaxID=298596 RepID=A0A1D8JDL3_9BACL|nr:SAM-dependent methyltransferase [Sporosarcina ureilytica]AOV06807.1 SAM-dependent methyltransferase [Sporosarcina ureilytica]
MNEKERDRSLHIQTRSVGERIDQSAHYHHYEATPYWMLDELFKEYTLDRAGAFVDYGCGKGRVLFYVHHRFQVPVVGIEMNDQLYREALLNEASYLQHKKKVSKSIRIEHEFAESYRIADIDSCFFLFNPFSLQIFMKVIHHILRSVEANNRTVDIILYYPAEEYIDYLEMKTPFTLFKEVKMPRLSEINAREKFSVFRFEG